MKLKDQIIQFKRKDNTIDYFKLEKLIPKLPSSFVGLIWKSIPSSEKIEVRFYNNLILHSIQKKILQNIHKFCLIW